MIELINVTKNYEKNVSAIQNLNLKIEKGEFVFFIGQSGAGKSTIIKLLLREQKPTEGQILFDGEDIVKLKNRKIPKLRRRLGVVFQDFRLLDNLDVYSNVAYVLKILGTKKSIIDQRVRECIEMVNLTDKIHHYTNQLSGGEQQRVSIARAIVNSPEVLLADEPTGNLDEDTAWEIMKVIENINAAGTTVIMATHAKEIVNKMKKRVVNLESGQIIRDEKVGAYNECN